MTKIRNSKLSRRSFIVGSAAAGGGLAVGFGVFLSSAAAAMIWPDWQ